VTDAFSVTNELKSTGESLEVCRNKQNATFADRVEGTVTLDINMPSADNVLAVTGAKLNIASAAATDGRVSYDGVVSANIIYYAAEENQKASVAVELPFSINSECRNAADGDTVTAKGAVTMVTTKIQRGNEIQIKADIEIEYVLSGSETRYVITELSLGEERVLPSAAFSVHIAKGGETLWDVAKSLGMTPELVLTQNPGLGLPLIGGERVIAYRHIKNK
jgi:phosphotransferase system HPr-like phosphotransfer protein